MGLLAKILEAIEYSAHAEAKNIRMKRRSLLLNRKLEVIFPLSTTVFVRSG